MLDENLRTLLQHDLECSEAFLQRAEEKHITSIIALMDNILDIENDGEPDMCDLLHLFHDESDLLDISEQEHEFKDELITLYHFAFRMQKAWNNKVSADSFNYVDHFHKPSFYSLKSKKHNMLHTTFNRGLIAFQADLDAFEQEQQRLAQAAK